jgi:DNA adenine methylase
MKTPITYYGGKQNMIKIILPLIPEHQTYCEPFFGGGAVFFAKQPATVEVINDTNREVVNFYRVVRNDFTALEKEIKISLHSRDLHRQANVIYNNPDMFSEIKRAWAFWLLAQQSFMAALNNGWTYEKKTGKKSGTISNKRENFTEEYAIRLQNVQIECIDALRIINSRDTTRTFFYIDPPYYNAIMGHYDVYTLTDFENLLQVLSKIKGKFLLSSYRSDVLKEYTLKNGWQTIEIKGSIGTRGQNKSKPKVEVLTANYEIQRDR